MKVVQNSDGKHEIVDQGGRIVAGPFDTNSAAWRALDRLTGDPVSASEKRTDFAVQKMLTSGPAPIVSSKKEMMRLRKKKQSASKAPRWLRDGAAAHFDPNGRRQYRDAKLGTFGPASEVRRIDPASYKPQE